jgi:ketosteroid isomerase-like protein
VSEANRRQQTEAILAAVNRRDFDALDGLGFHPEVEFHSLVSVAEGGFYRGIDGLRAWGVMADDMWRDFHIEVLDVIDAPRERILALLRLTGTARGSGVPLDQRVAQVWEWRDGLLWRNTAYTDHDDAYRAAGLTEARP